MAKPKNLAALKLRTPECRPLTFRAIKGKGSFKRNPRHRQEKLNGAVVVFRTIFPYVTLREVVIWLQALSNGGRSMGIKRTEHQSKGSRIGGLVAIAAAFSFVTAFIISPADSILVSSITFATLITFASASWAWSALKQQPASASQPTANVSSARRRVR
jgi:stalled ribosome alternative rescue factor ArfA